MKIVFFGTPEYVVPIMEAMHREYNRGRERQFFAVVTQPPKPTGRKQSIEHTPVDHWAYKHKLPIITDIQDTPMGDVGVLASYGQIIPQDVIDRFEFGIINVHPSALPEFRGTSPVQATLVSGKEFATVTVMKMDSKMDHGPVISTFREEILPSDTTESLRDRSFMRSADFILELLPAYLSGKIKPKEQNHDEATYTKLINKQDGFIDPQFVADAIEGKKSDGEWEIRWISDCKLPKNAETLNRYIHAMSSWPMAWTHIVTNPDVDNQRRIKLISSHIDENKLVLDKVQLEGKNEVTWEEFKKGYPNFRFH